MVLKVFTQPSCPKCHGAKKLCAELKTQNSKLKTEEYNIATINGLAEAAFYSVMATPSLILVNEKGKVMVEWRGEVPSEKEINSKLKTQMSKPHLKS